MLSFTLSYEVFNRSLILASFSSSCASFSVVAAASFVGSALIVAVPASSISRILFATESYLSRKTSRSTASSPISAVLLPSSFDDQSSSHFSLVIEIFSSSFASSDSRCAYCWVGVSDPSADVNALPVSSRSCNSPFAYSIVFASWSISY